MCDRSSFSRPWSRIEAKFWSHIEMIPFDTCWHWTGSMMTNGYGRISVGDNKHEGAHRISWLVHHGEIPDNLHVLHVCDVKDCVRIDHLFLGTPLDNTRDMMAKGRSGHHKLRGFKSTHCIRGHVLTPESTYISAGARYCRECSRIRSEKAFAKRRKYPKGHICRGIETSAVKLTEAQVREIRSIYVKSSRSLGATALGLRYGVDKSTILNIIYRKIWRHL